jgi:hypothetical protein
MGSSYRKLRTSAGLSVVFLVVVRGMENWKVGDALGYKESLISKLDKNREKCHEGLVS